MAANSKRAKARTTNFDTAKIRQEDFERAIYRGAAKDAIMAYYEAPDFICSCIQTQEVVDYERDYSFQAPMPYAPLEVAEPVWRLCVAAAGVVELMRNGQRDTLTGSQAAQLLRRDVGVSPRYQEVLHGTPLSEEEFDHAIFVLRSDWDWVEAVAEDLRERYKHLLEETVAA
jgi:hypothetical protein